MFVGSFRPFVRSFACSIVHSSFTLGAVVAALLVTWCIGVERLCAGVIAFRAMYVIHTFEVDDATWLTLMFI